MDLIAILTSQLGIEAGKAQGLAGVVLGKIEEQVGQKLGGADAAALRTQVPELDDWKAKAAALDGGGGGGGLLGAAGSLLGGAGGLLGGSGGGGLDIGGLLQLAGKAGLGRGAVEKLLPILVSFLKSRLDPALLSRVLSVVPGLDKLTGGATSGGGLGGLLGGIL